MCYLCPVHCLLGTVFLRQSLEHSQMSAKLVFGFPKKLMNDTSHHWTDQALSEHTSYCIQGIVQSYHLHHAHPFLFHWIACNSLMAARKKFELNWRPSHERPSKTNIRCSPGLFPSSSAKRFRLRCLFAGESWLPFLHCNFVCHISQINHKTVKLFNYWQQKEDEILQRFSRWEFQQPAFVNSAVSI